MKKPSARAGPGIGAGTAFQGGRAPHSAMRHLQKRKSPARRLGSLLLDPQNAQDRQDGINTDGVMTASQALCRILGQQALRVEDLLRRHQRLVDHFVENTMNLPAPLTPSRFGLSIEIPCVHVVELIR